MSRRPELHMSCHDPACGGRATIREHGRVVCRSCGADVPIENGPASRRPRQGARRHPGLVLILLLGLLALGFSFRSLRSTETLARTRRDPAIDQMLAKLITAIETDAPPGAFGIPRAKAIDALRRGALTDARPVQPFLTFWNTLTTAEHLQVLQQGASSGNAWFRETLLPVLVLHTAPTEENPWVTNAMRTALWNAGYESPHLALDLLEYLAEHAQAASIRMRARTNAVRLRETITRTSPPPE